uniref:PLAT domain-containing protein n=1 Tax=Anas platyrhynchos TaxID=8839 RepID=A0A8B9SLY0_ANAPL
LPYKSFLVTLYTGSRWGAGTKADVFLQLIGQNGTSDVHCLRHPQVPSFRRGSTDRFLLTSREDLGDICAFRVWHSNRGPSPGWFLSRAKVENTSTRKTWLFMCRKWLSLDKGDGLLERTFFSPRFRNNSFLICNTAQTSHHVLYRQPERRCHQCLGHKTRKINTFRLIE